MRATLAILAALALALGLASTDAAAQSKTKKNDPIVLKLKPYKGKKQGHVAGPNEGKSCATKNMSTASSTHNNVEMECSDSEGNKFTCICTLQCTDTCENYKFTTDCTPNNCKPKGVPEVEGQEYQFEY